MDRNHKQRVESPPVQEPDQLSLFDENIRRRLADIREISRCAWCRSPHHPIRCKGLCSSCYEWDKEQRKLAKQVEKLPPTVVRDPYSTLRHYLDVANRAVELCKIEGEVLEERLNQADPMDLEDEFHALSKKILGSKRGSNVFYGHTWYFYDFSPAQRIWIWYPISLMTNDINRGDRRARARVLDADLKNRAAERDISPHE